MSDQELDEFVAQNYLTSTWAEMSRRAGVSQYAIWRRITDMGLYRRNHDFRINKADSQQINLEMAALLHFISQDHGPVLTEIAERRVRDLQLIKERNAE